MSDVLENLKAGIKRFVSGEVKPIFRQNEADSIGHEFWTQDGLIFFDNRGPGHDGTITSDRTQAVATEVEVNENPMVPFVGLADRHGNVVNRIDMPFYITRIPMNATRHCTTFVKTARSLKSSIRCFQNWLCSLSNTVTPPQAPIPW